MADQTQEPAVGQSLRITEPAVGESLLSQKPPASNEAKPGWISSLLSESTQSLRNLGPAVTQTVTHPVRTAQGILQAQGELEQRAEEAFKKGNYVEGARHVINYLLPFIGPRLDEAGNYMQQGEYAKGVGATLDVAGQTFGPKVMADRLSAVEAAIAARASKTAQAGSGPMMANLLKAIPPSSSSPYTPADVLRASPYLAAEHTSAPITTVEALRDAADSAITQIEEHVGRYIATNPTDTIRTDPMSAARSALLRSPRGTAPTQGLSELTDLGLDRPVTLARADAIRLQLNAENQAVLKRNNYDIATARRVDPGFAAREAAVSSLRDGIYQQLENRGIQGVQELRGDEGAIIAIRNAAQRQIFNGDKPVAGTGSSSMSAKLTRATIPVAGGAAGAYMGGPVGAASGVVIGNEVSRALAPPNLTRDALVESAFRHVKPSTPNYPAVPPPSNVRALLPSHATELPPAPDTSYVRAVPAMAQGPNPVRLLPSHEGIPLPPAPDTSSIRAIPARGLVVRDPVTGRFKRVYTSGGSQ